MIRLVLGLGNIGLQYHGSRHNAGFEVVSRVRGSLGAHPRPNCSEYDWAVTDYDHRSVVLARPRTMVNRSGVAARALLEHHGMSPRHLLVVADDFNLPLGRLRLRQAGSDGGHNGLASVIEALETQEFARLRLGIGPVPDNESSVDFVLAHYADKEIQQAEEMFDTAAEAVIYALGHRLDDAMTRYNVNPA